MSEYYLPPTPPAGMPPFGGIVRDDGAWIPNDPDNRDWADYTTWVNEGHSPLEYPASGVPIPTGG